MTSDADASRSPSERSSDRSSSTPSNRPSNRPTKGSSGSTDAAGAPVSLRAADAPVRRRPSQYPEPFASRMAGRTKRALGDLFGLRNFGVNLTTLAPQSASALRHAHALQDEFIYVLEGTPTLVTDAGETLLAPGDCAGFAHGTGQAHHLVNRSALPATYLEIGDRTPGDSATYPDDDLRAERKGDGWRFLHKDGTPYA